MVEIVMHHRLRPPTSCQSFCMSIIRPIMHLVPQCQISAKLNNIHKGHSVSIQQLSLNFPARPSQNLMKFAGNRRRATTELL